MRVDPEKDRRLDAPCDPSRCAALDALPQQPPFRFLTTAQRDGKEGDAIRGTWVIDGREPFFAGHFPGDPVLPGVLIAEALAQLAGLLFTDPTIDSASAHRSATATAPASAPASALDCAAAPASAHHAAPALAAKPAPSLLVGIDMRYRAVVRPPVTLSLCSRLDRMIGPIAEFEVAATLGEQRVADGRLSLRMPDGAAP